MSTGSRLDMVDVAVSIVRAEDGRVLVAERLPRQISAGYWELPGGKVERGESPVQAAARELDEEIGIRAHALKPAIVYDHAFPTKTVRLHFFHVRGYAGAPHGREGQRLAWIDPAAPGVGPILPSNARILRGLALPPIYLTPKEGNPDAFLAGLPATLAAGARLVRVRAAHLAPDQRVAFARRVAALALRFGARVVLQGSAQEARRADLAGLHSCVSEWRRMAARPAVPLWGVCADDAGDLADAVALGADFAVLGPVLADGSTNMAMGWSRFAAIAANAPIPVYATGGMSPDLLSLATHAGAVGVACAMPTAPHAPQNH